MHFHWTCGNADSEVQMEHKKTFDELYSSETYKRICDPDCGLYYESAIYVFSYLENEMKSGKVA